MRQVECVSIAIHERTTSAWHEFGAVRSKSTMRPFGEGEPLLLIMGFGASGADWLPILPMLPGFKCIYFDNRSTGSSDAPPDGYTIPQMPDDSSSLLSALGIAKAKVFGI